MAMVMRDDDDDDDDLGMDGMAFGLIVGDQSSLDSYQRINLLISFGAAPVDL